MKPIPGPAIVPEPGRVYLVELCSGEQRRWCYLGPDARSQAWWLDLESGREFTESSVMYAWWIVGADDAPA